MILGMSTAAFTELHVIISLIGIASGIVVVLAMLTAKRVPQMTALFLITTVLTSATGFLFPTTKFDPADGVGVISLIVLAVAILALYVYKLHGAWRWIYVASAVLSLYLNAFVGVVQTFPKIGFFHTLAPTQTEPPFAIAQGILLIVFIGLGIIAARRFRPAVPTVAFG